ncbi:uracil phosphoribosyltransferase [Oenococcus oeni ATCC BAA-1163]|uniref:Uracil phosphoribosyltransferase n=4 Tax=Oenococcus oeni TaxID=1247 RepID=A0NHP0_OENOE|nr:uracil phosphoribosyltransferase [Oenococcus oeni ATCC BAA-1163]
MSKFTVINHPLIQHKLRILRDKNTSTKDFRDLVNEIAMLMAYEVSRDMQLEDVEIDTPVAHATVKQLTGKKVAVVPILRAGLGMVDGVVKLIPAARIGHIGMYRDEKTLEPARSISVKLARQILTKTEVIVVDPMLATGGSAKDAIAALKNRGAKYIKLMVLVAAPEGVKAVQAADPDVDIYAAALDDHLNQNGYIVPGLGDAGDRLFGTK